MGLKDREDDLSEPLFNDADERQSALEELAAQTLLVELFNAKQAEVFENIVFEGKRRYYIEDLTERDYSLENTTPYQLEIQGHAIEEHSWVNLLCRTSDLLLEMFPEYLDRILEFRCPWTKMQMFALDNRTNYKRLKCGLYLNCNHTALHACWFLQDLLDYFKIDKSSVSLLIHRPSSAEPARIKEYIEKRFKRNFASYICSRINKPEEYAEKVIRVIEKYLNPMLAKISKSYTNFFLFDDNATLNNYVKKVREKISTSYKLEEKNKKVLNKYLDYIISYYSEN